LFVDKASQMLSIPLPAAGKDAKADNSGGGGETLNSVRRAGVDLNVIRHARKTKPTLEGFVAGSTEKSL